MDAVKFLMERDRLCERYFDCKGCEVGAELCDSLDYGEIVKIVEKWSKEISVHTYYDEFCKRFPKTHWDDVSEISAADFCVNDFFGDVVDCPYIDYDCKNCWQLEYKGE